MTHTKNRMIYGRTSYNPISRFVEEIPEALIQKDVPAATWTPTRTYIENSTNTGYTYKPKNTVATSDSRPKGNLSLKEGDRVYHMTFGEGEILSAKPMGADVLYEVIFDNVGTKKLMGTYARLKKLN